jgi:hypothetical protein
VSDFWLGLSRASAHAAPRSESGSAGWAIDHDDLMRIGTWNLDGTWGDLHQELLLKSECDVWLLTEVRTDVELGGYHRHLTEAFMADGRHWSGIFSRDPISALADPHPASAAGVISGTTYCSSVLPWRSCGSDEPWKGARHADKMMAVLDDLHSLWASDELVWGGDWNQTLLGPDWAGSAGGREHVIESMAELGLQVPTAGLSHQIHGHGSIDHIAVGPAKPVASVERVDGAPLSDHDAYVVQLHDG